MTERPVFEPIEDPIFEEYEDDDEWEVEAMPKGEFKRVKVRRGATEIEGIIKLANEYGMWICGGYPRWMCSLRKNVHPPGDVDLFPAKRGNDERLHKYLISKGFEVAFETEVAWTYKSHGKLPYRLWPSLQVIKAFRGGRTITVGTLEQVLNNFDFTIVRIGLINKGWALADIDFKKDEQNKALKWRNIHCPISAVVRACKYAKKGYFARPMEILRLFDDWDDREPGYKEELRALFLSSLEEDFSDQQLFKLERMLRID